MFVPYSSNSLQIIQESVRGDFKIRPPDTPLESALAIEILINFKTSLVLMQRKDFEGLQKITFNEIINVQKCLTDADEQSFEMTIKANSMKIIRCESIEDCE